MKKQPLPFSHWSIVRQFPCIRYLSPVEKARLRVLTSVLLDKKTFSGEQGLELSDEMKLIIAAQACVPVLKLGINYYSAFVQVSVYPAAFWVERDEMDESGVVHHTRTLLSGESWQRGPVVLSWQDIEQEMAGHSPGRNVVIHEFSHKIDMLNGAADGLPPISSAADIKEWQQVFTHAYQNLVNRVEHHHRGCINAYAATSPAEFYAVASEYFFTAPQHLKQCSPRVYNELRDFYQQDPAQREESFKNRISKH